MRWWVSAPSLPGTILATPMNRRTVCASAQGVAMTSRFWKWRLLGIVAVLQVQSALSLAVGAEVGPLVERIRAVGGEGAGNVEAARAWRELVRLGPDALPEILAGLD